MQFELNRRQALKWAGATMVATASPVPAFGQSRASWVPDAQTEELLTAAMREHRVPGVGLAIIEDGALAWQKGYGVTNIETESPVTEATLFQAASLTKPLFVYVVMKLVDEGRIGFDDRLADFFRPADYVASDWNAAITVRHVLTHRTGLPNWRPAEDENAILQPAFAPGTAYSYSGEAFHWLQQVCETITGLGLHDLVAEYLFAPAGLSDMAMTWLPGRDAREVHGHVVSEDGEAALSDLQFAREQGWRLHEVAQRWDRPITRWTSADLRAAHAVMRPHTHPRLADRPLWRVNRPGSAVIDSASSLRTTAGDYAKFLTLMMPGRERRRLEISEELRRMMLTTQSEPSENGPNRPAGYGWALEPRDGGVAYDHWGFNAGQYISMGLGDTANRRGIVIMTNGSRGNRFMDHIGPIITGTDYRSFF
ncbi:serine hydrolase [Parasphingopyxis sp.]|uniref:serine hydrolase domain-containing protein n=1 Tax=Parasphingopyxis sp. TaxID=1920299 RepID=UPI0026103DBD|nr:serine hydrolase domain-containing protein [Parasphingopyxis sp.]